MKNSQIRAMSRQQLGGNIFSKKWFSFIDVLLVWGAFTALLFYFSTFISAVAFIFSLTDVADLAPYPFLVLTPFLELLLTPALGFGIYRMSLLYVREGRASVGAAFSGFLHIFRLLWIYVIESIFLFLWTLLFFIPGIVKAYSYALTPYIRQDNWKCSALECITKSRVLMKGNKWRLFCLDFSFIGWYILGALCFGIGVIFVYPYHLTARANFYNELIKSRATAE